MSEMIFFRDFPLLSSIVKNKGKSLLISILLISQPPFILQKWFCTLNLPLDIFFELISISFLYSIISNEQLPFQKGVFEPKWPISEYWDALWWVKKLMNWLNISDILVLHTNEKIKMWGGKN